MKLFQSEEEDDDFSGIMSNVFRRNLEELDDLPLKAESRKVLRLSTKNPNELSRKYDQYKGKI